MVLAPGNTQDLETLYEAWRGAPPSIDGLLLPRGLAREGATLDLLGFDDDELVALLADEDAAQGLTDEDAVPDTPQTPVSILGDLWLLGDHQVLCGDATASADVARILSAGTADLVFTDPPYNVDYQGYTA